VQVHHLRPDCGELLDNMLIKLKQLQLKDKATVARTQLHHTNEDQHAKRFPHIVLYCIYTFIQRFLRCTPIRSASVRETQREEQS